MYPFDVGRVNENLPTTHIEIGSKLERGTFELGSTTGKNSAYEGSGKKRVKALMIYQLRKQVDDDYAKQRLKNSICTACTKSYFPFPNKLNFLLALSLSSRNQSTVP
ncbi:hypothetical protein [Vibrio sp. F13]|uniref:hypothetical protein n=1 Tax=Vibrio sp. F13 TaxID=2070777 RepID=UPI0010BDF04E|nr:hypothetical protein [Vibrio sp. F13]TKG01674.1 hypothetical protein FCV76_10795 [Vibrio sp. F13]